MKMRLLLAVLLIAQVGPPASGLEECIYRADVAIVIDLSQDSKNLWTKTRIYIKDLLDELQLASNKTRVGALSAAPTPSVRFYLNHSNVGSAKYMIDSVGRPSGYGDIGETFKLLQNDFYKQQNGDRENTPNIVVLLTDGVSFERTQYNIYDHKGNLVLRRPGDQPPTTTPIIKPTNKPTSKATPPPELSSVSNSSLQDDLSNSTYSDETISDLTTTSSATSSSPSPTTTSAQDTTMQGQPREPAKNLTLHELQTRFLIHVTENSTFRMRKLASSEASIFVIDDVMDLLKGIQENSQVDCPTEIDKSKPSVPPPMPMVCDNLPCYGMDACKRSYENENVAICECKGKQQSKYCPTTAEDFEKDMNRTCRVNTETKLDPRTTICPGQISMLCPTFGPDTGGTDLFIWGTNFPNHSAPIVMLLPYFNCDVAFYNSTLIQCKTKHAARYDVQHSLLQLKIDLADGCQTFLQSAFHYRPSPEIDHVRPLKISPGGGQQMTILGQYLDSDPSPRLQVTASDGIESSMFASLCEIQSNTVIKCVSPAMDLSNFTTQNRRRKRSLPDLSFSMGMSYPGYTNFSESLPGLGKIQVVKDPIIQRFEEEDEIKTFRPAWPNSEKVLTIAGEYLLEAFASTDYTVRIGQGYCFITNMTSNQIRCLPPSKAPKMNDENSPHPEVIVYHGAGSSWVGHLRYDRSPWSNTGFRVGVSIAIVICILFIIAAIIYFFHSMRKKSPMKKPLIPDERKNIYLVGDYLDPNVDLRLALDAHLESKIAGLIMGSEVIQEDDTIQSGNQGEICDGWLLDAQKNQTKQLTIKAIKERGAPFMHIERFLEAAVSLRDCDHKNVMQVLGIVTDRNIPRAVYAHMEFGDLKQHLCDLKEKVLRIDFKEMLHYCEDAAAGLAHIHEKGIVHEDIAARNCWVDKQHVVRICDSALAPDLYEDEYYSPGEKLRSLPIRWMAPESLVHKLYTFKSDVWSFGVLLWEIMSLGDMPYLALSDLQIEDHIEKENRLNKPDLSTVAMYSLMTRCWAKDHKKRPTMQEISQEMESFIQGEFMNPTLARPPKGKKGGLSVLTTPVVKADTEYKGKFKKNSVQHDNRAFVSDTPEAKGFVIDEEMAMEQDYEAEYEYLKPDLIRMNRKAHQDSEASDVAIDVDGVQPGEIVIENKTCDVNSANYHADDNSVPPDAAAVDIDEDDEDGEVSDTLQTQLHDNRAYDHHGSVRSTNSDDRQTESSSNHGDHNHGYQYDRSSNNDGDSNILRGSHVSGNSSLRSRTDALLTGITASSLEADGYKVDSALSEATVLY